MQGNEIAKYAPIGCTPSRLGGEQLEGTSEAKLPGREQQTTQSPKQHCAELVVKKEHVLRRSMYYLLLLLVMTTEYGIWWYGVWDMMTRSM